MAELVLTESNLVDKNATIDSLAIENTVSLNSVNNFSEQRLSERPVQLALQQEILGPLLLEVIDGFLLVLSSIGTLEFISSNIGTFLRYDSTDLLKTSIYSLVHVDDHFQFKPFLDSLKNSSSNKVDAAKHQSSLRCRMRLKPAVGAESHVQYACMELTVFQQAFPLQGAAKAVHQTTFPLCSSSATAVAAEEVRIRCLFCIARRSANFHVAAEPAASSSSSNNNCAVAASPSSSIPWSPLSQSATMSDDAAAAAAAADKYLCTIHNRQHMVTHCDVSRMAELTARLSCDFFVQHYWHEHILPGSDLAAWQLHAAQLENCATTGIGALSGSNNNNVSTLQSDIYRCYLAPGELFLVRTQSYRHKDSAFVCRHVVISKAAADELELEPMASLASPASSTLSGNSRLSVNELSCSVASPLLYHFLNKAKSVAQHDAHHEQQQQHLMLLQQLKRDQAIQAMQQQQQDLKQQRAASLSIMTMEDRSKFVSSLNATTRERILSLYHEMNRLAGAGAGDAAGDNQQIQLCHQQLYELVAATVGGKDTLQAAGCVIDKQKQDALLAYQTIHSLKVMQQHHHHIDESTSMSTATSADETASLYNDDSPPQLPQHSIGFSSQPQHLKSSMMARSPNAALKSPEPGPGKSPQELPQSTTGGIEDSLEEAYGGSMGKPSIISDGACKGSFAGFNHSSRRAQFSESQNLHRPLTSPAASSTTSGSGGGSLLLELLSDPVVAKETTKNNTESVSSGPNDTVAASLHSSANKLLQDMQSYRHISGEAVSSTVSASSSEFMTQCSAADQQQHSTHRQNTAQLRDPKKGIFSASSSSNLSNFLPTDLWAKPLENTDRSRTSFGGPVERTRHPSDVNRKPDSSTELTHLSSSSSSATSSGRVRGGGDLRPRPSGNVGATKRRASRGDTAALEPSMKKCNQMAAGSEVETSSNGNGMRAQNFVLKNRLLAELLSNNNESNAMDSAFIKSCAVESDRGGVSGFSGVSSVATSFCDTNCSMELGACAANSNMSQHRAFQLPTQAMRTIPGNTLLSHQQQHPQVTALDAGANQQHQQQELLRSVSSNSLSQLLNGVEAATNESSDDILQKLIETADDMKNDIKFMPQQSTLAPLSTPSYQHQQNYSYTDVPPNDYVFNPPASAPPAQPAAAAVQIQHLAKLLQSDLPGMNPALLHHQQQHHRDMYLNQQQQQQQLLLRHQQQEQLQRARMMSALFQQQHFQQQQQAQQLEDLQRQRNNFTLLNRSSPVRMDGMLNLEQQLGVPMHPAAAVASSQQEQHQLMQRRQQQFQQQQQQFMLQQQLLQKQRVNAAQQIFPDNFNQLMKDVAPNINLTDSAQPNPTPPPAYGQSAQLSWTSAPINMRSASLTPTQPRPVYNPLYIQSSIPTSTPAGLSPYDAGNLSPSVRQQIHQSASSSYGSRLVNNFPFHHPSPHSHSPYQQHNNNSAMLYPSMESAENRRNAVLLEEMLSSNNDAASSSSVSSAIPRASQQAPLWNSVSNCNDSDSIKAGIRQLVNNRSQLQQQHKAADKNGSTVLMDANVSCTFSTGRLPPLPAVHFHQGDEIPRDLIEEIDSLMSDHPNVQQRNYDAISPRISSNALEITQRDARKRCQQLKGVASHTQIQDSGSNSMATNLFTSQLLDKRASVYSNLPSPTQLAQRRLSGADNTARQVQIIGSHRQQQQVGNGQMVSSSSAPYGMVAPGGQAVAAAYGVQPPPDSTTAEDSHCSMLSTSTEPLYRAPQSASSNSDSETFSFLLEKLLNEKSD